MNDQGQPPAGAPAAEAWQQPVGAWQGQQPQDGGLYLRTGFSGLAFHYSGFPPWCAIDGGAGIALRWGDNLVPVPAGWHHVRVWFQHVVMKNCGPAETMLVIPESGLVLEYKAPTLAKHGKGTLSIPGYGPAPAVHAQAPATRHAPGGWPSQVAPAGWHPDPTGRYELRWWDGQAWTAHVARGGVQASDPI